MIDAFRLVMGQLAGFILIGALAGGFIGWLLGRSGRRRRAALTAAPPEAASAAPDDLAAGQATSSGMAVEQAESRAFGWAANQPERAAPVGPDATAMVGADGIPGERSGGAPAPRAVNLPAASSHEASGSPADGPSPAHADDTPVDDGSGDDQYFAVRLPPMGPLPINQVDVGHDEAELPTILRPQAADTESPVLHGWSAESGEAVGSASESGAPETGEPDGQLDALGMLARRLTSHTGSEPADGEVAGQLAADAAAGLARIDQSDMASGGQAPAAREDALARWELPQRPIDWDAVSHDARAHEPDLPTILRLPEEITGSLPAVGAVDDTEAVGDDEEDTAPSATGELPHWGTPAMGVTLLPGSADSPTGPDASGGDALADSAEPEPGLLPGAAEGIEPSPDESGAVAADRADRVSDTESFVADGVSLPGNAGHDRALLPGEAPDSGAAPLVSGGAESGTGFAESGSGNEQSAAGISALTPDDLAVYDAPPVDVGTGGGARPRRGTELLGECQPGMTPDTLVVAADGSSGTAPADAVAEGAGREAAAAADGQPDDSAARIAELEALLSQVEWELTRLETGATVAWDTTVPSLEGMIEELRQENAELRASLGQAHDLAESRRLELELLQRSRVGRSR